MKQLNKYLNNQGFTPILVVVVIAAIVGIGLFLVINKKLNFDNIYQQLGNRASETHTLPVKADQLPPLKITINKNGLSLTSVKIKSGQSITWENQDSSSKQLLFEKATSDNGKYQDSLTDIDPIDSNGSLTYPFEYSGTLTYHLKEKPDVKGTIIVE